MITLGTDRLRHILLIALAAVVLGVASAFVLTPPGPTGPNRSFADAPAVCTVPALPGTVVEVTLVDMPGAMMGHGMMQPGWHDGSTPGMPARGDRGYRMHMMRVLAAPTSVPSGQVSLRVTNAGAWVHELAVLPLAPGEIVGRRPIGDDGQVDEAAALGHAARTCDTGEGDGIAAGGVGWVTVTLAPGRYELICNFAGHYGAGMYAELMVTD